MNDPAYVSQDKTLVITDHYIEKLYDNGFGSEEYRFIPLEHLSSCKIRTFNPWWLFLASGVSLTAAGAALANESSILGIALLVATAFPLLAYFMLRRQQLVFMAADGTQIFHDTKAEAELVAKLVKQTLELRSQARTEITRSVHLAA